MAFTTNITPAASLSNWTQPIVDAATFCGRKIFNIAKAVMGLLQLSFLKIVEGAQKAWAYSQPLLSRSADVVKTPYGVVAMLLVGGVTAFGLSEVAKNQKMRGLQTTLALAGFALVFFAGTQASFMPSLFG
ncbi:MAG: hypothetical protein K0S07_1257 [Chlamydiales bacterium]|jgi:hypothetical protein|nr:hypothetical protein [Chlamydiales bacterium]